MDNEVEESAIMIEEEHDGEEDHRAADDMENGVDRLEREGISEGGDLRSHGEGHETNGPSRTRHTQKSNRLWRRGKGG